MRVGKGFGAAHSATNLPKTSGIAEDPRAKTVLAEALPDLRRSRRSRTHPRAESQLRNRLGLQDDLQLHENSNYLGGSQG